MLMMLMNLDIWSNDYFLQIADMIEFAPIQTE